MNKLNEAVYHAGLIEENLEGKISSMPNSEKQASRYSNLLKKNERFSEDAAWMNRAVVMAKNTPIWLAQISAQTGKDIVRLDEIPDEILENLANFGITVVWLVGLWERSKISKKIKRMIGQENPEASAYSIRSYNVAENLGGDEALKILQKRAASFGLRIGADMVPNHTAIDAEWLLENPELYISTEKIPIKQYTFSGPDLTEKADEIEIVIEDHYRNQSDAAVVFKYRNKKNGKARYIYHGNDGVETPWNDTAQLDFTKPEVRSKVIDELVRLAKIFPMLRLDAAMLLIRQHVQRLWFPQKGEKSHIPSRQENGLSRQAFEELMPKEFWLEAKERLEIEAPDTLLVAEAYWTLESFFAHSLGMHKVYNVDFMRNLANENNKSLRESIKAALIFDPRLLKRQANYLSNPDEDSASNSFGKGDKYFGACTLLAVMPGIPLFAHGQIEGYHEKYVMDRFEPFSDELKDEKLIARHHKKISPLLRRRDLFCGIGNFRIYDAIDNGGNLLEHVYCITNGLGSDRVLVLFNNSHEKQIGRVNLSASYKATGKLRTESMAEALGIADGKKGNFREFPLGNPIRFDIEEILERGLNVNLLPYESKIYWNVDGPS